MDTKDDQLWFAQQLVDTLQREVAQKKAELAMLVSHRAVLLRAFSTPTFPSGYTASRPIHAESSQRRADRSNTMPTKSDPSLRCAPLVRKRSPAVVVSKKRARSPPHQSHPPRDLSSDSESSAESDYAPTITKEQDRNQLTRAGESSESSDGKVQPSPVSKKSRIQAKFPVVNWTQQIKKRSAASGNGESSSDSGDSASNDVSPLKSTSKVAKGSTWKSSSSAAHPGKAATQAQTLSPDAPPEDRFDWEVLRILGPWSPLRSSSLLAESSWAQVQKQQTNLPCKFRTMDEYRSSFEGLILEECKAHVNSFWDMLKDQTAERNSRISPMATGFSYDRVQESFWRFRPMYPTADDPFKYIEAEPVESTHTRLDTNELVLLTHNNVKLLAIVTLINYKGALLRTRAELPAAGGQCTLLRMANMVTLKREYVALCWATEIWDPLQQQLLNPLESSNFGISPPSENCPEEDVKVSSISKTVSAWKKERLFNKKQLCAVEALLRLQQGFLLVQGPPGTGKTSTIVGMVSAVHIEEPRARILVCASSNAAVDEIVSRLMSQMLDISGKTYTPERGTLLRLGVEKSIQPACLPVSLDKILQSNAGSSNMTNVRRETIDGASIVCCTISGSGHQYFDEVSQKFDLLIIDEAAQAQESEVLIALQRVKGRCVMVGDPCQLPAVVLQRPAKAYGRSLFERMQEAGQPVFLMTTQYRMHPLISQFPAATFYGGRLRDAPQCQSRLPIFKDMAQETGIDICGYRFKIAAYSFLDVTRGVEQGELVGHSISNTEEAEVVATVVHGVVKSLKEGVAPNIGVITPYLAQRSLIMQTLLRHGVDESACEVDTVDGFQGREKDVIILSCVRAHTDHGLGFVSDVRRMNVALTRARHSLIIVGHAKTLKGQSSTWNALVEDASNRTLFQILCRKPKPINPDQGKMDAGCRQANPPSGVSPGTVIPGSTPLRTEAVQQQQQQLQQKSRHTRFDIRTPGPVPNLRGTEHAITTLSSTSQELNQTRYEHRDREATPQLPSMRGPAAPEAVPRLPSHVRFVEEGPRILQGGSVMGDGARLGDQRPRDDEGLGDTRRGDRAEGWKAKVKIEKEEPCATGRESSRSPAIILGLPVPVARQARQEPPVRRMRGQISSEFKGSDSYQISPSLRNNAVKKDTQDLNDVPFERYPPPHSRGSESLETEPYFSRDNNTGMELGEDIMPRYHRGRERSRGFSRGGSFRATRMDCLDREPGLVEGRRDDWNGGMHGRSPGRGRQPFRGRFNRGRGRFHRSSAR